MTVGELIDQLKQYPRNATVLYRAFSEFNLLEHDDLEFYPKHSKQVIEHSGKYMVDYDYWTKPGERPNYVEVLIFPGN